MDSITTSSTSCSSSHADSERSTLESFLDALRAKLGTAQAITATAHKIARVIYHVLRTKEPYAESVFHTYDEQTRKRAELRLKKHAARLGFQVVPTATEAS